MKKKIIDFLMNYLVISIAMLVSLAVLFGIYLGFVAIWNFNAVLFGVIVITLIVSGVVTYIVTSKE